MRNETVSMKSLFCAVLLVISMAGHARCADVPYVDGYIGREPVRFLVDTGASDVAIPYRVAERLGIPYRQAGQAEYRTAGGRVVGYRIVLESVKVGNTEVLAVPAHVSMAEDGSLDILLGMSFLRHVTMTLHGGTVSFSP